MLEARVQAHPAIGERRTEGHRCARKPGHVFIALVFYGQCQSCAMKRPVCRSAFLSRSVLAVLPFLLALLLGAVPAFAAESWSLSDGAGHRLNARVFEQPFPEYPSGLRIRLNALEANSTLDHKEQLVLSDSAGQEWSLPNRSEEMVKKGAGLPLPAGSAQFDLDALMPRPSEALPLHLAVPTGDGVLGFDLTPDQAMTLHAMG